MTPRLFIGGLSERVYLSTRYRDLGNGYFEATTKVDITEEFERACLVWLTKLAGEDGHKYLVDGLHRLLEHVSTRDARAG